MGCRLALDGLGIIRPSEHPNILGVGDARTKAYDWFPC
ncbi:MAG: hypothetical protein QOD29_4263 [Alphaproteobacteria bacterium]|nr:hypothetical protein [Alphaproteobacteria bacterium]